MQISSPSLVDERQMLGRWLGFLALAWLPLLVDRHSVAQAAGLLELATGPTPYFIPSHAWLLYVRMPAALLSATVALLTPGLLLTWTQRRHGDAVWVMRAFACTVPLVTIVASAVQGALGRRLDGAAFVALLGALALVFAAWAYWSASTPAVREPGTPAWSIGAALAVPAALAAVLAPKFLWESLNGDGSHAFETARLAVAQVVPFWPASFGEIASFPGVSTVLFAFPAGWFMRLFGEFEICIRAPYLLALIITHAGIVALSSRGQHAIDRVGQYLVWGALAVYTVVQAFSSTYDPYSADLSMPGSPDTLQMAVLLAYFQAHLAGHRGWAVGFMVLNLIGSPSGLMLAGMWLVALFVTGGWAELPRIKSSALHLVAAVVLLQVATALLPAIGVPQPGKEHALFALLERFAFLQFTDWRRLLWVIVPVGIFPAVSALSWRHLDVPGRALLLVALAYFGVFYVQAHVMLHQFVPAMLLPLAVAWRGGHLWTSPVGKGAAGLATAAALVLSLPTHAAPVLIGRTIGASIDDRSGGYAALDPTSFRRGELLTELFPKGYRPVAPGQFQGSPLTWMHYAQRAPSSSDTGINYVLASASAPAPAGFELVAASADGALYVKDRAVWERQQWSAPPTPAGSALYATPRGILFRSVPLVDGPWVLDIPATLQRAGFDLSPYIGSAGTRQ